MTQPSTKDESPLAVGKPRLRFSVSNTAEWLQHSYLGNVTHSAKAEARAELAQLRKLAGQPIDRDPLAISLVLGTLQPDLSDRELGQGNKASPSENAAFHALTLFALHMQGATSKMHVENATFASACGRLVQQSESGSIKPRFDAMVLARNSRSRLIHARNLISLLRNNHLGFDYGRFAVDLRDLENPKRKNGVLLRWGRDFAIGRPSGTPSQEIETTTEN